MPWKQIRCFRLQPITLINVECMKSDHYIHTVKLPVSYTYVTNLIWRKHLSTSWIAKQDVPEGWFILRRVGVQIDMDC